MPKIKPFFALRYDKKKVALSDVVCPPYDVINKRQRREYSLSSAYNIVRIVLPERRDGKRDYYKAGRYLYDWIDKGILRQDMQESIYIYLQEYKLGKKMLSRYGLLTLLGLDRDKKKGVLPHEKVFTKPLMDRVSLMKATKAHLSPIFLIFREKTDTTYDLFKQAVKAKVPDLKINFDGIRHTMWQVADRELIDKITANIARSQVFIADGHHRFEASLAVRDHFNSNRAGRSAKGHNYTLAYLVSAHDKGLCILPTYRAVKVVPDGFSMEYIKDRLSPYFQIKRIDRGRLQSTLDAAARRRQTCFIFYYNNRYLSAVLKDSKIIEKLGPRENSRMWRSLDVSVLHYIVLTRLLGIREKTRSHRNIYYYKDVREVVGNVDSGKQRLGIFLNAPTMKEVEEIASSGERMPHKSTYFYPKPLTGMVVHKF